MTGFRPNSRERGRGARAFARGLLAVVVFGTWSGSAAAQPVFVEPDLDAVPVVLVPGWADAAADIEPFRQRFLSAGWPESRVRVVDFQDPVGSNRANAKEIGRAVQGLLRLTGAEKVDLVAHSMGGLAVRYYLQFEGGGEAVRRTVFLGTPHRGTVAAMLAWGEGGREMVPGSAFLSHLNDGKSMPPGVEALALRTPVDLRVIPGSSAILPGAFNLEVCCPTHTQMVDDQEVFDATALFLREGPDALSEVERPGERQDWGAGALGSWTSWDELWSDSFMRRLLLPSVRPSGGREGG